MAAKKEMQETERFLATWMKVRQMVQAANFNRFQQAGLSATQFMTLNVVPREGMTLSELGRKLNLSASSLNETVNSLEERGLVKRKPHATDGRKVGIHATKAGEKLQNAASGGFHAYMAGLFAMMSRAKREGLLAGLEELVRVGEQAEEEIATRRGGDAAREKRSLRRSAAG